MTIYKGDTVLITGPVDRFTVGEIGQVLHTYHDIDGELWADVKVLDGRLICPVRARHLTTDLTTNY